MPNLATGGSALSSGARLPIDESLITYDELLAEDGLRHGRRLAGRHTVISAIALFCAAIDQCNTASRRSFGRQRAGLC